MINTTIAHYKITTKLGQGGMGAVYQAHDTKLDREVAIKVLSEEFAQHPVSLARFEREAKALAQLNHPHIAAVYGFDQSEGRSFLVLELVGGEDLSARLRRGPLPVDEALNVGRQIAEALEAAHEKGIIHRDLKPGNVKLTEDGKVKVLDFGLAKVGDVASALPGGSEDVTAKDEMGTPRATPVDPDSPTITADSTIPGVILGTAGYMSPEQARGKAVDKRSDIWSFGVVLFECLTGQRIFTAETVTDTIGAVLHKEPDWAALPSNTPPIIHLLLRKCLTKDRRRRLRDIGDAMVDLEQAIADPDSSFIRLSEGALRETTTKPGSQWPLTIGVVLLACLVMAIVGMLFRKDPPPEPSPIRRISMNVGIEGKLNTSRGTAVQFSPDGSTLAFIAESTPGAALPQLYLRQLDRLEATPIRGTQDVSQFCFSPDGRWIVFRTYEGDSLQKVAVTGGAAVTLCEDHKGDGMDWSEEEWIVFSQDFNSVLYRVLSAGGVPEPLTSLGEEEKTHRWPQVLPGGRAVLFTAHSNYRLFNNANVVVQRLPEGEPRTIVKGGYHARYLPSGHLVYVRQGTLFAAAFDLDSLSIQGPSVPVVEGILASWRGAHYDVSAEGTLVYLPDSLDDSLYQFEWIDREGTRQTLPMPRDNYSEWFQLSPDGLSLAYVLGKEEERDIWIHDLNRGSSTRLTSDQGGEFAPVWSPSGGSIVFSALQNKEVPNLYWKRTDGSGAAQRLTPSPNPQIPLSWHPGGREIIFLEVTPEGPDLRVLEVEGSDHTGWMAGKTTDFLATPFQEDKARFSPDGRWLAYDSTESGQSQVFVRSFPDGGGKQRISIEGNGSSQPSWSPATQELIFVTEVDGSDGTQNHLFTANFSVEADRFVPERPVQWKGEPIGDRAYNLHPDGKRLLFRRPVEDANDQSRHNAILFENFFDYLREQVPNGKTGF